MDRIFLYRQ